MQDRVADIEARLAAVEKRLAALEGTKPGTPTHEADDLEPTLDDGLVATLSAHIGRVLLIFGGAYLLRAITDFQFVATALGLLMGATYAVAWLFIAYRKAAQESGRATAAFYSCTSVLLALPLLVEAVTKFEVLSGRAGVLALTIYFAAAIFVAVRRKLRSLAWFAVAGSIGAAMFLLIAAHIALATNAFLLFLGLVSLWAVYRTAWMGLQWLGGAGVGSGLVALIAVSHSEQWDISPRIAALFALLALLGYLVSFVVNSHLLRKSVALFEPAQTIAVGAIAFWAVGAAIDAGQLNLFGIGLVTSVLGVGSYALALSRETRRVRKQNFFYYTTLGLLLIVVGTTLMLPVLWAATTWCALALLVAWQSGRTGWVTLSLQCTFLLVAAGIGSGAMATGLQALVAGVGSEWPQFVAAHPGIALTTVACLFIPVAQSSERWGVLAGLPQLIVLVLSVWEVGGLFVAYTAPLLAGAGGAEPDASIVAALRTAVLSVASITLAFSSRFRRWPEARWLVYPLLILVAIKLFAEDFPHGQPATLFVALAFVGSALLLVARLLRRRPAAS
jgi:hypothetical protein